MSLLLDARKKLQQAQDCAAPASKPGTYGYATRVEEATRNAGKNLFDAKSAHPSSGSALPNQNLLLALGCAALLTGIGVGYLWYVDSSSGALPPHPASTPPAAPAPQPPVETANAPLAAKVQQPVPVPGIGTAKRDNNPPLAAQPVVAAPVKNAAATGTPSPAESSSSRSSDRTTSHSTKRANNARQVDGYPADGESEARGSNVEDNFQSLPQPYASSPVHIERRVTDSLDPLLGDAYGAYHNGKLDEAQKRYLSIFKKDARNADALLGLAAIAQRRGDDRTAAQYYGRVLELDPRHPVANAGMAALMTDDGNNESRLKNLLREHGNSAALHFALGNLYAGQSRWGEAQQVYFNAYTLEPGNAEYAFNLAVSLEHLGQTKLAIQHYQRALQLDPSRRAGFDHAQISQHIVELNR